MRPVGKSIAAASWRWLGAGRLSDPYAAGVMARSCRLPVGGGQPAPVWLKERRAYNTFPEVGEVRGWSSPVWHRKKARAGPSALDACGDGLDLWF